MTQKQILTTIESLPKDVQFAIANSVLDRLAHEGPPPISEELNPSFYDVKRYCSRPLTKASRGSKSEKNCSASEKHTRCYRAFCQARYSCHHSASLQHLAIAVLAAANHAHGSKKRILLRCAWSTQTVAWAMRIELLVASQADAIARLPKLGWYMTNDDLASGCICLGLVLLDGPANLESLDFRQPDGRRLKT
jgi:hypothetical protein